MLHTAVYPAIQREKKWHSWQITALAKMEVFANVKRKEKTHARGPGRWDEEAEHRHARQEIHKQFQ